MKGNGGFLGKKTYPKITSCNGIYDAFDQGIFISVDTWPYTKTATLTPDVTSINETTSNSVVFTINTQGYEAGTTLYWTVNEVSGTIVSNEFLEGYTGSVMIIGNEKTATAQFTVTVGADGTPDGTDQFNVQLRETNTSGPVIATSSSITINDTSTSGMDYITSFMECRYGADFLNSYVYVVDANTGAIQTTLWSATGQTGSSSWFSRTTSNWLGDPGYRLCFAVQQGASWNCDWSIDNVAINGTTYNFNANATGWLSPTNTSTSSITTAFTNAVQVQDTTATGFGRWNRSTNSPSSGTGPASVFDSYFLYSEASSYFNSWHWLFSPIIQ